MNDLFDKILTIGDLSTEEKDKFKETFYKLLVVKTLASIAHVDSVSYVRLSDALREAETHPKVLDNTLKEIAKKPQVKEKVNQAIGEVLGEIAQTLSEAATEEQRKEILASLS